jgi:hypothetical protein
MEGGKLPAATGSGVVTGDEVGRSRGTSALQQHAELDALIALHAWIRRDALRIPVLEVANDFALEILLEIPDVVREIEHGGDAPRIVNRVNRAAATVADRLAAASPHREGDPEGTASARSDARRGNAGVHSTRHRHGDHR